MFPCIMTQYTKMTNKMQVCRKIYYSLAAVHVSSDIFAHHQAHLNCITASGITHACRCQPAVHKKVLPEDGSISAETCRRNGNNTCILLYMYIFLVY